MTALDLDVRVRLAAFELAVAIRTSARSIGVFGPSGAGKTTLLDTIVGWRRPDSGRVAVAGTTLFDSANGIDTPLARRAVGYVPQDSLLFPHWTVARNITATKRCDDAFLARVIDALELKPLLERSTATLSGGERRRVALARAVATSPKILVLDEPLVALDKSLRARILSDIIRVRAAFDVPLVLVSHDATEILAACDEVFVLERGRAVASGAPDRVLRERSEPGAAFENVCAGVVRDVDGLTARVALAHGPDVFAVAPGAVAGEHLWLGLDAEDVLVAGTLPTRISARNVLPGVIDALAHDAEGRVRAAVRLANGAGAPILAVDVTRSAADELGLEQGSAIHLVFKASSCRVVARGAGRQPAAR